MIQKKTPIRAENVPKRPKLSLLEPKKKVKQRDRVYKNSFLVGQIDCKTTKEKSKLLLKCFVNSFRKKPLIDIC